MVYKLLILLIGGSCCVLYVIVCKMDAEQIALRLPTPTKSLALASA